VWEALTRRDTTPSPSFVTPHVLQEAGLYLLVRPALDIRLPSLVQRAAFAPPPGPVTAFSSVVAGAVYTLAARSDSSLQEEAGSLAGDPAPSLPALDQWARQQPDHAWRRMRGDVPRLLMQQRVAMPSDGVVIRRIGGCLFLAPEGGAFWMLGRRIRREASTPRIVHLLLSEWRTVMQQDIAKVFLGPGLVPWPADERGMVVSPWDDTSGPLSKSFPEPLLSGEAGLTLALLASALLQSLGRWLPGLTHSSSSYLWEQFVHRPGSVTVDGGSFHVRLQARPLDAVLRMSGALEPLDSVPWLGKRLQFTVGG
jgi:hypothetical protein